MAEARTPEPDYEKLEVTRDSESHHSTTTTYQKTAMPRWLLKGKERSTIERICTWIVDNQIPISLTLTSSLFLTHSLFPSARHHTQKFFSISYYNPSTGTFALGWDDIFFVFFWIIVFTGLRCMFMSYLLSPFAEVLGLKKPKAKTRFAEQAWIFIYPTFSWCTGMYVLYNSDYWLDLHALWRNWPVREMDGLSKWYYLVQFAFWLQQIVVVNIEERRKDHWQMFSHHLITCALIFCSYGYHQTRVGNLILCLMDVVDLFLPLAKILKYLRYRTACDATFGIFMVTWFAARHVCYLWVCWSIYAHIPEEIQFGCYHGSVNDLKGPIPVPDDWNHLTQPFKDPVGLVCWNQNISNGFLGMLLALQVIMLVWFTMIIKVAYKVITGQGAEDVRSDDEDSEEEEEEEEEDDEKPKKLETEIHESHVLGDSEQLIEKEVLSTDSDFVTTSHKTSTINSSNLHYSNSTGKSSRRKGEGHSSGVNLLAGSDRKELLGRIGCDKGTE